MSSVTNSAGQSANLHRCLRSVLPESQAGESIAGRTASSSCNRSHRLCRVPGNPRRRRGYVL